MPIVLGQVPTDYRPVTSEEREFLENDGSLLDVIFILDDEGFDWPAVPAALPENMFPEEYDPAHYYHSQSGEEYMASYYNSDSYINYVNNY